jgi:hypothetical protein
MKYGVVDAREMSEWQPIETAPKDGSEILLLRSDGWPNPIRATWTTGWEGSFWRPSEDEVRDLLGEEIESPISWMPSPEPPK